MQSMRLPSAVDQWNWWSLSIMVHMEEIMANPDLPWSREGLSQNKDITVEAMDYLDHVMTSATGEWEWWHLSIRVPMEEIRERPDLPWDRYGLSWNKDITVALMDELDQEMTSATGEWEWRSLSREIPIGEIRLHLDEVLASATGEWDWYELSRVIPMDEIRARPDLPWDHVGLAFNPGVTVDDVLYMGVTGDIDSVVSMEEIKANPSMEWSKRLMSLNPSISMEMVMANPDD